MIERAVQKTGGIAYGHEFEYAPDSDDTGILITILSKYYGEYED